MRLLLLPLATGLGMFCNLAGTVPQALRTLWQRRTEGLAPTGLWLSVIANALWLGYGIAAADMALLALNATTTVLVTAVLLGYARHSPSPLPARLSLTGCAALAFLAAVTATGHPGALAAAGAALGFITGVPQLLALLRGRGLGGVAAGTYRIGVIGSAAWALRWGLVGETSVVLSSCYGLLVSAAGLLLVRHRPLLHRAVRAAHACTGRPGAWPLRRLRGALLTAK